MLLEPHAGIIIWTIVTFLVVFVILKAKVWGPLLAALDAREGRIREALESAERAREEARLQQVEHEERLAEAEAQARQIVAEAHQAAERVSLRIVAEARAEAERSAAHATQAIEAEKRAALSQLRREVADIAVGAASAILGAELDAERNRKLADDFIASLPEAPTPGRN